MKILFALIATLVATVSSTEDKPAALPLLPYAYPHAYGGVPFLGSAPLAYAVPSGAAAPLGYAPNFVGSAAVLAPVPAAPLSHVHQAQDEFGNTNYGYVNLNSAKQEIGNGHVGVTGSYQYVDANNQLQTVNYVADALGFRVADSRLPVAPTYDGVAPVGPVYDGVAPVAPVYDGVAPEPVKDTPEVIAARAEHLAAFEKVAAEHSVEKREADPLSDPQVVYGWNALAYPYGGGFYTPSLAYHDHGPYPYVAGYGPSAYTFGYRRFY